MRAGIAAAGSIMLAALAFLPADAAAMPPDIKYFVPPAKPWSSAWAEAEDAESNIPAAADAACYAGRKRLLDTDAPPGSEGYYVRFRVPIPGARSGRHRLYAAIPDTGRPHLSPFALELNGARLREFGYMPWGNGRWGAASTNTDRQTQLARSVCSGGRAAQPP